MTSYQIDSDALNAASSSIHGTMGRVTAEVSGLMAQLTALQSSWTGRASAAFQTTIADWRAVQQRVEETMTAINQALARAAEQYSAVEETNTGIFIH